MGDILKNLNNYKQVRDINFTKQDLIDFEEKIVSLWEGGKIKAPVHLSHGNEDELIEVFSVIDKNDYIFSTKEDLIEFENKIVSLWEGGEINELVLLSYHLPTKIQSYFQTQLSLLL